MADNNDKSLDNTNLDVDLLKALENLGISEDDLKKATVPDKDSVEKGDQDGVDNKDDGGSNDKDSEIEKSDDNDLEKEIEDLKKSLAEKEEALKSKTDSKDDKVEKSDDDEINKDSQNSDLLKSLFENLSTSISGAVSEKNEELIKAINDLREENTELKKSIEVIGSQYPGMKSVNKHSFIEKAEKGEDEDGRKVFSVSKQKNMVLGVLNDAIDTEENNHIKKSLEDNLVGYNAGGAPISEDIAKYLYDNKGVRLVK